MDRSAGSVWAAFASVRGGFSAAAGFSFFISLLALVSPLYMMQIYNRVLPSRSEATLLGLTGLAVAMLLVMAALEIVRARIMVRASGRLELALGDAVMQAMARQATAPAAAGAQPLRDFDAVRQFLSSPAMLMLFDAPWSPVVIAVVFLLHPLLGTIALGGAVCLFALAILNEIATRRPLGQANLQSVRLNARLEAALRNAEVVGAMGMFPNLRRHWREARDEILRLQGIASDRAGAIAAASKGFRLLLQTGLLAAGAWLAINDLISPGVIIASSILVGRALAPVESAIGTWKQILTARTAYTRLRATLQRAAAPAFRTALPAPTGRLSVEAATIVPPGAATPVLRQVAFALQPGEVLGIVGRSGAGKTSLARALVGVWPLQAGKVRLDGADLGQWDPDELGRHIGYLPQDVELLEGTVSENIARFGRIDSGRVVAAAQRAGAHEMILGLPKGYDTPIGPDGGCLSGGQRQRVGLARAIYGQPALVVLDEPNANLDDEGDVALQRAVLALKQAGTAVVLISQRSNVVDLLDRVLVLADGTVRACGPRQEVLSRRPAPNAAPEPRPAKVG
ncbi:MAG: type I secretion system permease/ATPase [Dongiaceae bacterium]